VYALLWTWLAIAPHDRQTWVLENVLVVLFAITALVFRRRFSLSHATLIALWLFLVLHAVGSHFTYSEVPYDAWWRALTGTPLSEAIGSQRNHFDRFVHFAGGLLLTGMLRELISQTTHVALPAARVFAICLAMAASLLYELIEWGAAATFGGNVGPAYVGTQGDPWDAQKDMALASLGACIAMFLGSLRGARSRT
jgi:putative membrane protein